jgi:hypothetical protein
MARPVPVNARSLEGTEVADLVAGPLPPPPPLDAVVGEPPWLPPVFGFTVVAVSKVVMVVGAAVVAGADVVVVLVV